MTSENVLNDGDVVDAIQKYKVYLFKPI
jgi:hypothetical protein